MKIALRIFIEIALNIYMALCAMDILVVVFIPVHEHGISFICIFFSFFHQSLIVFSVQVLLPSYFYFFFIVFAAVMNGIVLFLS